MSSEGEDNLPTVSCARVFRTHHPRNHRHAAGSRLPPNQKSSKLIDVPFVLPESEKAEVRSFDSPLDDTQKSIAARFKTMLNARFATKGE